MPDLETSYDPSSTVERVITSALDLTRAEAGLALARAKILVVKVMAALLTVILATAAAQVSLVLLALSPVLYEQQGWSALLLALVPALSLTVLGALAAFAAWRALKNAASSVRDES